MKKIPMKKNKAGNIGRAIFVSMLLILSISSVALPVAGLPPKLIYGTAVKCNSDSADGCSVVVSASGYPDETTTVSSGAWSVDIGPDSGTEWPDSTSFTVTITCSGWSGSKSGSVSGTYTDVGQITLYPPDVVADAHGSYSGVVNDPIQFSGSASGGCGDYTWDWDFGDGSSHSSEQNPSHTYTSADDYTATLTVNDCCSLSDVDTASVHVDPPVTAEAGGPYSGTTDCSPVQFSGSASGGYAPYTWDWDFGDGSSHSSEQNPSHTYTSADDYTATLTVTDDNSNTDSDTAPVDIDDVGPLNADAGGPYTGTICSPVQFSGSVTGGCPSYSWDWDFGDGGSHSYVQNPSHQYSADGSYTVTLIVTDSFADTDSDTASVTISTSSVSANAHGPYYGIPGDTIQLSGSASGGCSPYSWDWDFGDGSSHSHQQNPSHSYAEGDYTATLTVTDDDGESDSDTTEVHVHVGVQADAGGPYSGAIGEVIPFSGSAVGGSPPYTFAWDLDDDGEYDDASGASASKSWDTPGVYAISLKATDSTQESGTNDTTVTVILSHPPNKPDRPSGKTGPDYRDSPHEYKSKTTDPDGDQVSYLFEWGDGTDSGWVGPVDSGEEVTVEKSWTKSEQGSYEIKVKAKDIHGVESEWSEPLPITVPKNKAINPFILLLERLMDRFPIMEQILQPIYDELAGF